LGLLQHLQKGKRFRKKIDSEPTGSGDACQRA